RGSCSPCSTAESSPARICLGSCGCGSQLLRLLRVWVRICLGSCGCGSHLLGLLRAEHPSAESGAVPYVGDMAELPTRTLGDGISVPVVGFGTYPLRGDAGVRAMVSALEAGYRFLDTAVNYRNEREVAE